MGVGARELLQKGCCGEAMRSDRWSPGGRWGGQQDSRTLSLNLPERKLQVAAHCAAVAWPLSHVRRSPVPPQGRCELKAALFHVGKHQLSTWTGEDPVNGKEKQIIITCESY